MLFDCVQVNTGLGFRWICNSERKKKGGGGICELMMLSILNHFSLFDLLVVFDWWKHINMDVTLPFWVIMRSGRWNVMNHIATKGGPYLVVEVRGILLPWVIVRREGRHDHIWISNFLWRQFRWVGLCPYMWHMGGVCPYMGTSQRHGFLGWLKCPLPNYYHLKVTPSMKLSVLLYQYQLDTCLAHHKPYS